MKELYLAIITQLQAINSIRYIDIDKGQLNAKERSKIASPAILIGIGNNRLTDIDESGETQVQKTILTLRLVFDTALYRTAHTAPELAMEQSLSFLNIEDEVYKAVQNFAPGEWIGFSCTEREIEQTRDDGYVTMRLVFESLLYI